MYAVCVTKNNFKFFIAPISWVLHFNFSEYKQNSSYMCYYNKNLCSVAKFQKCLYRKFLDPDTERVCIKGIY